MAELSSVKESLYKTEAEYKAFRLNKSEQSRLELERAFLTRLQHNYLKDSRSARLKMQTRLFTKLNGGPSPHQECLRSAIGIRRSASYETSFKGQRSHPWSSAFSLGQRGPQRAPVDWRSSSVFTPRPRIDQDPTSHTHHDSRALNRPLGSRLQKRHCQFCRRLRDIMAAGSTDRTSNLQIGMNSDLQRGMNSEHHSENSKTLSEDYRGPPSTHDGDQVSYRQKANPATLPNLTQCPGINSHQHSENSKAVSRKEYIEQSSSHDGDRVSPRQPADLSSPRQQTDLSSLHIRNQGTRNEKILEKSTRKSSEISTTKGRKEGEDGLQESLTFTNKPSDRIPCKFGERNGADVANGQSSPLHQQLSTSEASVNLNDDVNRLEDIILQHAKECPEGEAQSLHKNNALLSHLKRRSAGMTPVRETSVMSSFILNGDHFGLSTRVPEHQTCVRNPVPREKLSRKLTCGLRREAMIQDKVSEFLETQSDFNKRFPVQRTEVTSLECVRPDLLRANRVKQQQKQLSKVKAAMIAEVIDTLGLTVMEIDQIEVAQNLPSLHPSS